ncbi:hypothetical protein GCM10027168_45130 [Streptomyces capparidis]
MAWVTGRGGAWDGLGGAGHPAAPWEFETPLGLGPDRLRAMARRGHPTREYVVFGTEPSGGSTCAAGSPRTPSASSRPWWTPPAEGSTAPRDDNRVPGLAGRGVPGDARVRGAGQEA